MSVITVSRELGSQGIEIAQAVANRFNYQCVDKEKIGIALADCGLPQIEIEKLDEKKPSFWDSWTIDRNKFFHHLQMMIYEYAQKNNVVIVGRGGQILLKDLPGVLHVRVFAPFDVRIRRIMEQQGVKEKQAFDFFDAAMRTRPGLSNPFSKWTGRIRAYMTWRSIRKNFRLIRRS